MGMEETSQSTNTSSYNKRPMWQWVVLYLLIAVVLYGAFYYFFLAKKGAYNSNTSQTPVYTSPTQSAASPTSQAMSNEMTVTLDAVNNSKESGTATLTEDSGKTTVTVDLTGFTQDVSQPAHIHIGNCPGVGAVKYPLTNIVNGKSVTVLPVTISDLKSQLPLAINVHVSAKDIGTYTACGELHDQ